MPVCCQTVINILEKLAPRSMAEEWDNVGLQIGEPSQPISKIYLSLDITDDIIEEAVGKGADMLVVHHTPFFKPLKKIRTDLPTGKSIVKIIKAGMALYTAHTNLDVSFDGVNDVLARLFNLNNVEPLTINHRQKLYKLAVYVPEGYAKQVHEGISQAGAGCIGNYSECSFQVKGTGTFRPLAGSQPFIGQLDKLEKVDEVRLETIVPEEYLESVLQAMRKAHPYEEIAYDVFTLVNEGKKTGLGRIGRLPVDVNLGEFIKQVKDALKISQLRYVGDLNNRIKKVALCGGSGAMLVPQAIAAGADVFVTADLRYHEAQEGLARSISLVDPGHYAMENPVIAHLAEYLRRELVSEKVEVIEARLNTDPFRFL